MLTGDPQLVRVGDRVLVRDRLWRVSQRSQISEYATTLQLESLDQDNPRVLSVAVPPDEVVPLPNESLSFDLNALDGFTPWAHAHMALAATLVQETGLLSGARFGRVELEAYQIAPTLRILAKPRPRLLIADDVGLGKTIEAGLVLLELLARRRVQRVLVVTPAGLVLQWEKELREKFGLDFVLIENAAGLARVQSELPAGVNPWDALPRLLTSVDFLKKETVRNRALRKPWDLVVVDEAHGLAESGTPANPYRTQRTRLGLALRNNARGLLLLTATPHNGYPHSFRSLVDLVEPTLATFHGVDKHVGRRVASAMIRRMKAQILRHRSDGTAEPVFPKRTVRGIPVRLRDKEKQLLQHVATYCSRTARLAEGTEDVDLVTFAMQIVKKRALSSRQALLQTLEHRLNGLRREGEEETRPTPAEIQDLRAELPLDERTAERSARRILRSAIPKDERRRQNEIRALNSIRRLLRSLPDEDPKIQALIEEIRAVLGKNPEDKLIVFTEYLDTLDAIRQNLEGTKDFAGRMVILKGGLSGRQRTRILEKFEQPGTCLLLATDAASEGLNLQRCCHQVIHFELPWNPNRLEQRNGRVDRYGQTRPPVIRYLYYPESPEEDVLHRLVEKIERMHEDRISTPDILGVLAGSEEIDRGLVALDPEEQDVGGRKNWLIRHFEDRTAEFVRNVRPLLLSADTTDDGKHLSEILNTAHPLLPDDGGLEQLVQGILGADALRPTGTEGILRIEVPLRFRGPGVEAVYPRATFRREVATRFPAEEVEYITPLHRLVQAIAADSRRRLLQVYPGERGLPPRRLAARRVPAGEPESAVITFWGGIGGGGGLLEEHLVAMRVTPDLTPVSSPEEAARLIEADFTPGEVSPNTLTRLFGERFEAMAARAAELAEQYLDERARLLEGRRREQAAILRRDLEVDVADRLREIEEEEKGAQGLIDDRTGQFRLFQEEGTRGVGLKARRAAVEAEAAKRRQEIAEFERVDDPAPPRPLGALFLVPEGVS